MEGDYEPNLGTIYFNEGLYESQKECSIPELSLKVQSLEKPSCDTKDNQVLSFKIKGTSEDYLYYKTFTEIIIEKMYGSKAQSRASCEVIVIDDSSNVELNCITDDNFNLAKEGAMISTDKNGYSRYVKFSFNRELDKIICSGNQDDNSVAYIRYIRCNTIKILFSLILLLLL